MGPLVLIVTVALSALFIGLSCFALSQPSPLFRPVWTVSYRLYQQPHAVWLDQYAYPGVNLPLLKKTLNMAQRQKKVPELVIYAIPLRDLGQSSEGGFASMADYWADNEQNAGAIRQFV